MPLDNNFIAKMIDKRFVVKADSGWYVGISDIPPRITAVRKSH